MTPEEEEQALRFAERARLAEAKASGGGPESVEDRLAKNKTKAEAAHAKPTFLTKVTFSENKLN